MCFSGDSGLFADFGVEYADWLIVFVNWLVVFVICVLSLMGLTGVNPATLYCW